MSEGHLFNYKTCPKRLLHGLCHYETHPNQGAKFSLLLCAVDLATVNKGDSVYYHSCQIIHDANKILDSA